MSLITELVCVQCGAKYKEGEANTCPRCGPDEGILDVRFDLARAAKTLTRQEPGRSDAFALAVSGIVAAG